jgi:hypothetical protein
MEVRKKTYMEALLNEITNKNNPPPPPPATYEDVEKTRREREFKKITTPIFSKNHNSYVLNSYKHMG